MAVPRFELFLVPVLRALGDGRDVHLSELRERVAEANVLGLTPADMLIRTRKGRQTQFENRANWAGYYLYRSGLLEKPNRGTYRITEEGQRVLKTNPTDLSRQDLEKYPGYKAWKEGKQEEEEGPEVPLESAVQEYICSGCRYFSALGPGDKFAVIGGAEIKIDDELGECRAHPPEVSRFDSPGRLRYPSKWPVVKHDDWCGEWDDLSDEDPEFDQGHPPTPPPTQRPLLWPT